MIPRKSFEHGFTVGQRVQAHPATDTWMRGDRYGTVEKLSRRFVHVRLDRSGRIIKFHHTQLLAALA